MLAKQYFFLSNFKSDSTNFLAIVGGEFWYFIDLQLHNLARQNFNFSKSLQNTIKL
jgi:hypothetical protein